jgi:hypothetical protein
VLKVGKISVSDSTVFHDTRVREFFFLSFFLSFPSFIERAQGFKLEGHESAPVQGGLGPLCFSQRRRWRMMLKKLVLKRPTESSACGVLSAGVAAVAGLLAQETDKPCQCPAPWTVLYAKHPIGLTPKNLN